MCTVGRSVVVTAEYTFHAMISQVSSECLPPQGVADCICWTRLRLRAREAQPAAELACGRGRRGGHRAGEGDRRANEEGAGGEP